MLSNQSFLYVNGETLSELNIYGHEIVVLLCSLSLEDIKDFIMRLEDLIMHETLLWAKTLESETWFNMKKNLW